MSNYVFIYKEKAEDRDCVKYVDMEDLEERHKDINGRFNVTGPCFSMGFPSDLKYTDVITVLTKSEWESLRKAEPNLNVKAIIDRLKSKENKAIFKKVQQAEKEYIMAKFNLSVEEVEEIWEYSYDGYADRGFVGDVFEDAEQLGENEIEAYGDIPDFISDCIDYEKFGRKLLDRGDCFVELKSGRCVVLYC